MIVLTDIFHWLGRYLRKILADSFGECMKCDGKLPDLINGTHMQPRVP